MRSLLLSFSFAAVLACTQSPPAGADVAVEFLQDGVQVTQKSANLSFGEVPMGASSRVSFKLVNLGSVRTEVAPESESEGAFRLLAEGPFQLAPGERIEIGAEYAAGDFDAGVHEERATFRFVSAMGGAAATVTLDARALKAGCEASPDLDFGALQLNGKKELSFEVRNPGTTTASFQVALQQESGAPGTFLFGDVNSKSMVLEAGGAVTVPLTYSPGEVGAHSARVEIQNGPCGSRAFTARGIAKVGSLSVSSGNCGAVPVGQQKEHPVSFSNDGEIPLRLYDFENSRPEFIGPEEGSELVVQPGDTEVLVMRCAPTQAIQVSDSLTFRIESQDEPVSLSLRVFGGGPVLETDSAAVSFGDVPYVNGASDQWLLTETLTVRNSGTGAAYPLILSEATLSPDSASTLPGEFALAELFASPRTLAVGESLPIAVQFSPQSGGDKRALLTLKTNDFANPIVQIPIVARAPNASPCQYSLDLAELDFGRTSPGSRRTLWAPLTNTGAAPCYARVLPVNGSGFTASAHSLVIAPGDRALIPVTLDLDDAVPAGLIHGALSILVSAPTQLSVPLQADVGASCLFIGPGDFDFGPVQTGCASESRALQLYGTCASKEISLQKIEVVGAGFTACTSGHCGEFRVPDVDTSLDLKRVTLAAPHVTHVSYAPTDMNRDLAYFRVETLENGAPVSYVLAMRASGSTEPRRTETFVPPMRADVLMVIDDSTDFGPYMPAWMNSYLDFTDHARIFGVDWQLGVTTTDTDGLFREGGRLVAPPPFSDPIVRSDKENPAAHFAANLNVGTIGSASERGVAASLAAVTPPLAYGLNRGLLRDDAALGVFVLTDARDQSGLPPAYALDRLRAVKGIDRVNEVSYNATAGFAAQPSCSYDTGPDSGEYRSLIEATGGLAFELCASAQSGTTHAKDLGTNLMGQRTRYFLSTVPSDISTINLANAAGAMPQSMWTYDPIANAIDFTHLSAPQPGERFTVDYARACVTP